MNYSIILAAGKGTRMKSDQPKCSFPLVKKPMVQYIIEALERSDQIHKNILVVGHKREVFEKLYSGRVLFAVQEQQLGTGHAAKMAEPLIDDREGSTVILPGDMPLITTDIIDSLLHQHYAQKNDLTVVTTFLSDPTGYGRIVRNREGNVSRITEHKDASLSERLINEVNTGLYCVQTDLLFKTLEKINSDNAQGEFYLTDIVGLIGSTPFRKVGSYVVKDDTIVRGVNNLYELSIVESRLRMEINKKHMLNGVMMINPETITIGDSVQIEAGVSLNPNTVITGRSVIHPHAVIGPNTEIHDSIIGAHSEIRHSLVLNSQVGEFTTVGPFAHLRDGAIIGNHNRIGNFVEVKKSTTGEHTKASHLAYIGDAEFGNNVNFGCGAVTVNYDGKNKYKTIIGDNVFVGCNTNLIAPITVSDNAFIAAGSTLTIDVPEDALAIARAKQVNKENYAKRLKGK